MVEIGGDSVSDSIMEEIRSIDILDFMLTGN